MNSRTARLQLKEDMERANKTTEKVGIKKTLGPGDLFGVRAIEKGFYGGVSQVDLSAPSTRPQTSESGSKLLDRRNGNANTESVISSFNQPQAGRKSQKSPDLLGSPTQQYSQSRTSQSTASSPDPAVDMAYNMPASPGRKDRHSASLRSHTMHERSPSDNSLTKPGRAYDPQPAVRRDSHKTSPLLDQTVTNVLPGQLGDAVKSPTFNVFPSAQTSRRPAPPRPLAPSPPPMAATQPSKSDATETSSPVPLTSEETNVPAIQLRAISSYSSWGEDLVDSYLNSRQSRQYSPEPAQPQRLPRSPRTKQPTGLGPFQSIAESRSPSTSPERSIRHERKVSNDRASRSRSSSASRRITRTNDSIRKVSHGRKVSTVSIAERKRDVLHYDPSVGRQRTRAGSIPGRPVNFDRPRDSPFSDLHSVGGGVGVAHSIDSGSGSSLELGAQEDVMTEEDNELHLQRENERKISQWKARELRRAIEAAKMNGTIPEDDVDDFGTGPSSNQNYSSHQQRLAIPHSRPAPQTVQPSRGHKQPPKALDLSLNEPKVEDTMMASPLELVRKWRAEEEREDAAREKREDAAAMLQSQRSLAGSPEERAKAVMEGLRRTQNGERS